MAEQQGNAPENEFVRAFEEGAIEQTDEVIQYKNTVHEQRRNRHTTIKNNPEFLYTGRNHFQFFTNQPMIWAERIRTQLQVSEETIITTKFVTNIGTIIMCHNGKFVIHVSGNRNGFQDWFNHIQQQDTPGGVANDVIDGLANQMAQVNLEN